MNPTFEEQSGYQSTFAPAGRPSAGMSVSAWPTFSQRLARAFQDGIIWGVKLAVAFGLILVAVSYLLGDYSVTRQRSLNGQQAFEFIQRQLAAQQSKAPVAAGAVK